MAEKTFSLASCIIGLVCYALSSTFNQLLGAWIWWKILLYIVFSFLACLAVWYAPARSRDTSLRLEDILSCLVLIITAVYSFFSDIMVKGKPDAYILISCAAFAIMSLGLSNLTQFGFQIDLLHFFCGCLIVLFMKIKWWLFIVGGVFSYFLFWLRDNPRHTQAENLLPIQNPLTIPVDDSAQAENLLPIQNPLTIPVDDSESGSDSDHATVISQQEENRLLPIHYPLIMSVDDSESVSDSGLAFVMSQQEENCLLPVQYPLIIPVGDSESVSYSGLAIVMSQQAENRPLPFQYPLIIPVDDSESVSDSGNARSSLEDENLTSSEMDSNPGIFSRLLNFIRTTFCENNWSSWKLDFIDETFLITFGGDRVILLWKGDFGCSRRVIINTYGIGCNVSINFVPKQPLLTVRWSSSLRSLSWRSSSSLFLECKIDSGNFVKKQQPLFTVYWSSWPWSSSHLVLGGTDCKISRV